MTAPAAAPPFQTAISGPWKGVNNTAAPYDDTPDLLQDAGDVYFTDPVNGSPAYAIPNPNTGATFTGGSYGDVYRHIGSDGTVYNFAVLNVTGAGPRLCRLTVALGGSVASITDVTPTNVRIGLNCLNGYGFASLAGNIIFNDSVTKPWIGSNLSSTPITATPIDWNSPSATPVLMRGSTDTQIGFTRTVYFPAVNASTPTSISPPTTVALPAGTIPINQWGVFKVTDNGNGSVIITAGAANFTTGYANEAAAIAALPTVAGFNIGYFTVQTHTGTTFRDGTDALAGGSSGNPANATNYYAGESDLWTAWGTPEVYGSAVFFIMRASTTGGTLTNASTNITWSEVNQPNLGYSQLNYSDWWQLTQTGSDPLYTLKAENSGLYYARALSWGVLVGYPGVNFQSTAQHDVISVNVGCVAPKTAKTFGTYLYFCDQNGKPWRFPVSGQLGDADAQIVEPIWKRMQAVVDAQIGINSVMDPAVIQTTAWAVVEPNLNKYLCAPWKSPTTNSPGTASVFAFDGVSGVYEGQWFTKSLSLGSIAGTMGGGLISDSSTSYVCFILQESGAAFLMTIPTVTQGTFVTDAFVQTNRLAYSAAFLSTFDAVRAVELTTAKPMNLTITTRYGAVNVGNVTPATSSDGTYVAGWMLDPVQNGSSHGMHMTVSAISGTSTQWRIDRVEADYVLSRMVIGQDF